MSVKYVDGGYDKILKTIHKRLIESYLDSDNYTAELLMTTHYDSYKFTYMFSDSVDESAFLREGIVGVLYTVTLAELMHYRNTGGCASDYQFLVDTSFVVYYDGVRAGYKYHRVSLVSDSLGGAGGTLAMPDAVSVENICTDLSRYTNIEMRLSVGDGFSLRETMLNLGKGNRTIYLFGSTPLSDICSVLEEYDNKELCLHLSNTTLCRNSKVCMIDNINNLFKIKKMVKQLNFSDIFSGKVLYKYYQSAEELIYSYVSSVGEPEQLKSGEIENIVKICCKENASSKEEADLWVQVVMGTLNSKYCEGK